MKDAYAMEDKEVLDRLANMHINFPTDEAFKKYHNAMQLHDMNYLRSVSYTHLTLPTNREV